MSVQQLANVIATAVNYVNSTRGMATRGIIAGDTVSCDGGTYAYDLACPINLYDGKEVWCVEADSGVMVIVGGA